MNAAEQIDSGARACPNSLAIFSAWQVRCSHVLFGRLMSLVNAVVRRKRLGSERRFDFIDVEVAGGRCDR